MSARHIISWIFLTILLASGLAAQQSTSDSMAAATWKTLAKVDFTHEYDDFLGFTVEVPRFLDEVKALEGEEITIRGYIIPIEGYKNHKEFFFSAYPYNMCFFCGGAGPETVMDVEASDPIKYTAEPITIRGRLRLNEGDINELMYKLEDAVRAD